MVAYSAGPLSASSIDHASFLGLPGVKSNYPHLIGGTNPQTTGDERKPLKDKNTFQGDTTARLTSLPRQRQDGRRSIELEKIPSLAHTSPLYGRPAWWGEEGPLGSHSDSEVSPMKASSCILRELDPKLVNQSNRGSSSQPHSREQDQVAVSRAKPSSAGTLSDEAADKQPTRTGEEGMQFTVELESAKKQKPVALKSHRSNRPSSVGDTAGDVRAIDHNTSFISSTTHPSAKEKRTLPAPSSRRLIKGGSPTQSKPPTGMKVGGRQGGKKVKARSHPTTPASVSHHASKIASRGSPHDSR